MLSKILTASALAGSFGSRTNSAQCQSCVLELDALFSSWMNAYLSSYSSFMPAHLEPYEYRLEASDVLANFLRLSNFQSRVNLFFAFLRFFISISKAKQRLRSHSAKSQ